MTDEPRKAPVAALHTAPGLVGQSTSWNYRVIHTFDAEHDEHEYAIHEVYYDAHDRIMAWSVDAVPIVTESQEGLFQELSWMMEAIVKPVLERTDLPGGDDD